MENVLIALLCIALMIFAGFTIAQITLDSQSDVATAWKEMESNSRQIARTDISSLGARTINGGTIGLTLANAGETKLEDFDEWDVILQYYDTGDNYLVKRLTYSPGAPDNNEWTVGGIYLDASSKTGEAFEPGIFNPDEELIIKMKINPRVGSPTANMATVAASNGVSATAIFTRGNP